MKEVNDVDLLFIEVGICMRYVIYRAVLSLHQVVKTSILSKHYFYIFNSN